MRPGKIAAAATAAACMTMFSFGWSAPQGVFLSVDRAQAVESHTVMEKRAAVSHQRYRHTANRYVGERRVGRPYYGPNPVQAGADVAAGAVNTAGAVAAGAIGTAGAIAAAPFGEGPYAMAPGYEGPYYAASPWGDYECTPGAGPYECKPYASKGWYHH
jgi:hypothetical protein